MEINIRTTSKQYPVFIEAGALKRLERLIAGDKYTKLLVITDNTVEKLHMNSLKSQLAKVAPEAVYYVVPSGEAAKQFSVYESCLTFALEQGLDRKSCILAFGGGAVGDVAGFTAATYMRGISFLQIPTTILAHDSAVGGKTGVNHPIGKNMIGAFHQPDAVLYDLSLLHTLPPSEIRSGFAEAIKHALIADQNLLHMMMEISDFNDVKEEQLAFILRRGIEIKASIVSEDEKEQGVRAYLNFGHTLGHAIESVLGYGRTTHGEAVMIGMVYALMLSQKAVELKFPIEPFIMWVRRLGYSLDLPKGLDFQTALSVMERDKKTIDSQPRFVLLESVGNPILSAMDVNVLEEVFLDYIEMVKSLKDN